MAFTAYHNISGSTSEYQELIKPGDNTKGIKSILLTNTDTEDIVVDLYIQDQPASGTATSTFYILKGVAIPQTVSLLIDDAALLSFDGNEYGLYITTGSSETLDILINV